MVIFVFFLVCIWFSVYNFPAGRDFSRKNIFWAHRSTGCWRKLIFKFSELISHIFWNQMEFDPWLFSELMPSECILKRCDELLLSFSAYTVCAEATQFGILKSTRASRYRTPALVIIWWAKILLVWCNLYSLFAP